jgi:hypothetical protein
VLVQLWLKWGGHDAVVHKVCRFWWPAGSDGTDHGVHARGRACVVDRSGTVTSPTDRATEPGEVLSVLRGQGFPSYSNM